MLRNNKIPKTSGCSSVWLERYLGVVEAVGSSPVTQTKYGCLIRHPYFFAAV